MKVTFFTCYFSDKKRLFFMHTLQKNEFFFVLNRTIIFNI